MDVLVQNLESKLYLARDGSWVQLDGKPATFPNAVEAVSFCIQRRLRAVRMVTNAGQSEEKFVYPFGADPAIKAERKKLRRAFSDSRRLKQQQRELIARIQMIQDGQKETRKQAPFKRKRVAGD
jgi:hypothetical protein